jgi:hypothetical protein
MTGETMAKNENEPQSYGSQGEWLTGKTGEKVNETNGHPTTQHGDFYESRIEGEQSPGDQGGKLSNHQLAENAQAAGGGDTSDEQPVSKVNSAHSGAKRDSQFKRRDYE